MSNKIALITGGSRGLGRSAAVSLARHGAGVVITYRVRADEAEAALAEIAAAGGRGAALRLDVGDIAGFPAFVEEFGATLRRTFGRETFDHLVNNAGHGHHGPFAQTSVEAFDALAAVHLRGPYFLTQALLPLIADGGRIVNLSSGLARFTLPGMSAYAAMKGAIEVLTRYLAKELGPRGIAVNTVAPGAIETDFGGGLVRDDPDVNRMVAGATALGRAGVPDDIGRVIAALLSDDGGWINGQRVEVSGGVYL